MKPLLLALTALPLFAAVVTAQQDVDRQIPETSAIIPYGLPSMPVGPDDLLYISVYDSPALSRTARAGSNGTIRLPLLKHKYSRRCLTSNHAMPSPRHTAETEPEA